MADADTAWLMYTADYDTGTHDTSPLHHDMASGHIIRDRRPP